MACDDARRRVLTGQGSGSPLDRFHAQACNIRDGDLVFASYPGSGHAWLANLLLELAVPYYDPYTEQVPPAATGARNPCDPAYRDRFLAQYKLDRGLLPSVPGPRVVKTHLGPGDIGCTAQLDGVLLLVRDGYAAIESYYHWRHAFVPRRADQDLGDFLALPAVTGLPPLRGWAGYAPMWEEYCRSAGVPLLLLKFETARQYPDDVAAVCDFLGRGRSRSHIVQAMRRSTFGTMRCHERWVIEEMDLPAVFVMRSGAERCGLIEAYRHDAGLAADWALADEEMYRLGYRDAPPATDHQSCSPCLTTLERTHQRPGESR